MNLLLEDYIDSHTSPEPDNLRKLERDSYLHRINGRMCSGHLQGRMLKMLAAMAAPMRALELGTFTGYSALCLAEGLPPGGRLTTVEVFDELESPIRQALAQSPWGDRIELVIDDAEHFCALQPDESFDLIFIDADKRRYPEYLAECKRMLTPGGFIIADNTLWDGHVTEPDRNDPQTAGIKRFNDLAVADPDLECVIMPMRDGMTLLRKRNPEL